MYTNLSIVEFYHNSKNISEQYNKLAEVLIKAILECFLICF
jgi:hypothetical protein